MEGLSFRESLKQWNENILPIYEEIKHYYGEERVDLQNNLTQILTSKGYLLDDVRGEYEYLEVKESFQHYIIIYWDKATVTNERGLSTDITDVYVRLTFNCVGCLHITVEMLRSSYTQKELDADYMHSHIHHIHTKWQSMCLGDSSLLILMTELHNKNKYEEGDYILLSMELDKAIHTESLAGVPWVRIDKLKASSKEKLFNFRDFSTEYSICNINSYNLLWRDIICDLVRNSETLYFSYFKGKNILSSSIRTLFLEISNVMIKHYNKAVEEKNYSDATAIKSYLLKGRVTDEGFYSKNLKTPPLRNLDSLEATFKGKQLKVTVIKEEEKEEDNYYIKSYYFKMVLSILSILSNYEAERQFQIF